MNIAIYGYGNLGRGVEGAVTATPDMTLTGMGSTEIARTLNSEGVPARYTPAGSPEHGSVVLSVDGTFRYLPEPGYTGKDTFAYTYNNYLGESQICYVEITVE